MPGDSVCIFFFFLNYLFIYLWLCWVFVCVRGLSLVAASGGHSSSRCAGLSLSRPLLLWSAGSRRAGSVIAAHGPSCSAACGIFPDQGSNPCPLHWQADSQPLHHQGSPVCIFFKWGESRNSSPQTLTPFILYKKKFEYFTWRVGYHSKNFQIIDLVLQIFATHIFLVPILLICCARNHGNQEHMGEALKRII